MDTQIQEIVHHIQNTISPDPSIRRNSEHVLLRLEMQPGFLICLLSVISQDQVDLNIRLSASILLKNVVRRRWRVAHEDGDAQHDNEKLSDEDRVQVKSRIIDLMLSSPQSLQVQLSEVISYIGKEDFPDKWLDLLPQLVSKFQTGDFHVINGVLRTAHSLFRRYRHEFRSDTLFKEILHVLHNFAQPLTDLFVATMQLASQQAANKEAMSVICNSLLFISKIFYSLNFQDLPEFFEDNMDTWMGQFKVLLKLENKLLDSDDENEAGIIEEIRSQICDNVGLYAGKYDEEFAKHLPDFVRDVWALLLATDLSPKYDLLVSNAIKFLASVAERAQYKQLFQEADTLQQICEKVIIPNMHFRPADEEQFADNPEEYIRRDIEGSDVDTRRRAACDLVRALCKSFEGPVIANFSQYVQHLLATYAEQPLQNWKSKDVAVYLVTSLAAKGQTLRHGVTQATELVNITQFCSTHVIPELQSNDVNANPVIKSDCLKFLMTFRSQLPLETLVGTLSLAANHLFAESHVTHSYAAAFLEKVQLVRGDNQRLIITKDSMPDPSNLFSGLFAIFQRPGSGENDYAMKCLMRSLNTYKERFLPSLGLVVPNLIQILVTVSKNPSKPLFNHFLFESLCISVVRACAADPSAVCQFEATLFPIVQDILQRDVSEFLPYCFQLLALLLEQHAVNDVPDAYWALFPFLTAPILWERHGNLPALVRLLQAFLSRGGEQIPADKVNSLLGIFQKLLPSKANDHLGFELLFSLVEYLPEAKLSTYMSNLFILIFQRLQSARTVKLVRNILVLFSLYTIFKSADALVQLIDSIQAGMFAMVVERLFVLDMQKLQTRLHRKICAVGVCNLLTNSPVFVELYPNLWAGLLQALVGLFELQPADQAEVDLDSFDIEADQSGYQNTFCRLVFAQLHDWDPCKSVVDVRAHLVRSLYHMSVSRPSGEVKNLVGQVRNQDVAAKLQGYFAANQIQLA